MEIKDDMYFLEIEDDLIFFRNGRRPPSFWKWKKTTIFLEFEADLNLSKTGRQLHFLGGNGR